MAKLKELLQEMVTGSEEHKWKGITPQCVALIVVRSPEEREQSHLGPRALICNSYPMTQSDADEYGQRFCEPAWRYVGHIFAYPNPGGGTQFEAHTDPEFGEEEWIEMMKSPVSGTGLTYQEKIMCRMTGLSYEEYSALKNEDGAMSSKDFRLSPESLEARMKNTRLEDLPKHKCAKGNPLLGFAPLDFDVMKQMGDRDATKEEIGAQVKTWIEADSAKSPNPAEPEFERFKAALHANVPFAIYCRQCLEVVCLIQPELVEDTAGSTDEAICKGETKMAMKNDKTLMDVLNLYSTVRIDHDKIRKAFVTVVYPPESAGFGIPKVIVSTEELSEEEIGQDLDDMAKQNARWLTEQVETNPSGFEKLS